MKVIAESGLWTIGSAVAAAPAVAVLEVSGAVLAWTVDDPLGSAATRVTFTDLLAAEWLWRVVGESGHVALVAAVDGREPDAGQQLDVAGGELDSAVLAPLRRLAVGHWLRRWWPTSARDGIVGLDPVVLDGEVALLTLAAQAYFTDDTFDSDVEELLRPHRAALAELADFGDPRVAELARTCVDLADDIGIPAMELAVPHAAQRRSDYALAAGSDAERNTSDPIARGVGSVDWAAVPPGLFDAADRTVDWAIELAGVAAVARVRVATTAPVAGVEVRLRSGAFSGVGLLTADGRATLPLLGAAHQPVTETQAWDHDWPETTVIVGADAEDSGDSADAAQMRARLRDFARGRLARPGDDAFLAELLAAESDY